MSEPPLSIETLCVHPRDDVSVLTRPLAPPLHLSSVFETPTLDVTERAMEGDVGHYVYSRTNNPTVVAFEATVATLEGAEAAVATGSGMAAISALLLALLAPGDHAVAADDLYGTTQTLLTGPLARLGISVTLVDAADPSAVSAAIRPNTRLLFVETVSNPLMRVADVPQLAEIAHDSGALLAVDASFTSPALSRPLTQGADVVLHSATKYLGGHSDVTSGILAANAEVAERVRSVRTTFGGICSPLDAWLALRGIKTLALRLERHSSNALAVAGMLCSARGVRRVYYAGLPDDPHHDLAQRLLPSGTGGMLAFELEGGRAAVERFLAAVSMIRFAASLADTATTISYPALTSHRAMPKAQRERLGITDGLLRLSAGIEAVEDIRADLERGMAAV